ncbi:MAG: hydantoinase/oxoprolinase family protein [Bryobacteraceae bacterium]|nr:hydantoinase/oxoprolinase family protein [Bryobacteraceae bacterium]
MRIGVDAGGTFTDFVVERGGRITTFKLRSNPADPASVVIEGIERAAQGGANVDIEVVHGTKIDVDHGTKIDVVHGTTVATNALLERKGARTAFVTNEGFADLLAIGRQNRRQLYSLTPQQPEHLVPPDLRFGAGNADKLRRALRKAKVESVAICLLHAYRDPSQERALAAALGDFRLSVSSEVCPEFREYERASTTVIDAYVAPLMDHYLRRLSDGCPYPLSIVQSNGGVLSAEEARAAAVRTILSGPAGGVVGAIELAKRSGYRKILAFDMGGTSTDVSLSDGRAEESMEAMVDGMPVRVPMLDIQTVGAGGGSIARIDEGGLLRVGPESAGANPGPACYGEGTRPTVTDAHVALGRVSALLGGEIKLDKKRSLAALRSLGMDPKRAAQGVVRVANANMLRAIRAVSVERGRDPREYALLAFGGCGGLHACELAEELGIRTVLAPEHAGVLSALGMLLAEYRRDFSRGVLGLTDFEPVFRELESRAGDGVKIERFADLRYRGQSYELTVPWKNAEAGFAAKHKNRYGYAMRSQIEVVTLRVRASRPAPRVRLTGGATIAGRGPATIAGYGSTLWIPRGWRYRSDGAGTLVVSR